MVTQSGRYVGSLRCEVVHDPSGARIGTDAPKDNEGEGALFSPTDLVGAALGTCVATTIAIVARRRGFDVAAMRWKVEKEMTTSAPRRIARLGVTLWLPASLTAEQRQVAERAAHACPVHASLHPDVEAPIDFVYE
jgi:putative redox protein